MEVNLMQSLPTPVAAEPAPPTDGPSFDEFFTHEEVAAEREAAPRREKTDRRDDRDDRDDRAGAQAERGHAEARPAREQAERTEKAGRGGPPGKEARQAKEPARPVVAVVATNGEAPPAAEVLPEALTKSSTADQLARAMMAQHGAVEGEGGPATQGDTVSLTHALLQADDAVLDLTAPSAKAPLADGAPAVPLRPVSMVATPAGTRHGQAVTTRLPAGVDETSVMRQITDGLRLKNLGRKQTAEIRLDPPELGKVTVKVQMEAGVARISIGAEHAAVADLLGQSLDQLRQEMMAQGVHVESFEVSYHG